MVLLNLIKDVPIPVDSYTNRHNLVLAIQRHKDRQKWSNLSQVQRKTSLSMFIMAILIEFFCDVLLHKICLKLKHIFCHNGT